MSKEFIKIYSTNRHSEIPVIKSILGAHKVVYFIRNEHFSSIASTMMDVMVALESEKEAEEMLSDFLNPKQ